MKKIFSILVGVLMIFSCSQTFAKEHLIEAQGNYTLDSRLDETFETATARAREEAKRDAAEKAGVYIQSYSKVINLELDYDEIKTVAARVLKIQDEQRKTEVVNDNLIKFTVYIKALVDDNQDEMLKKIMEDKTNLEESVRRNNELQKEYDNLKKQMAELQEKYNSASETQKVELKKIAAQNTAYFNAVQELEKANEFYSQKNYSQALTFYNNAIQANNQSAEAYNNRGLTYYHLNQLANAMNDFNKAIQINPSFSHAYNNRGIVRVALGQTSDAIQDYTSAIKLNPSFAYALNNRGNAYAAIGNFQNAAQDLKSAVNLDNNNAEIHNNLGSLYLSMRQYTEAVAEYTLAIQLNSNYAEAYYNRAAAYYGMGKFVDALPDAKRAMDLNPGDSETRNLYNMISKKLGG